MTTKAKKDETPEAPTDATIAAGNAQNAENVAAQNAEAAKVDVELAKERDKAAKLLASLEDQHAKMAAQMAELEAKQAELAQKLDQPNKRPATLKLRSTAFNPQKALDKLADIWPKDGPPVPVTVVAKTYRVTPTGKLGADMPIADVTNCSDQGDAKAAYAARMGRHVAVTVEEIGREEFTRATADPVSADA